MPSEAQNRRQQRAQALVRRQEAMARATQIATRDLILADELDEETLSVLMYAYPAYRVGHSYKVGDLFHHRDQLFEVLQEHTSQADWIPADVPALYRNRMPAGVIAEWVQPAGGHDAYQAGDRVVYDGKVWESTIDANVWAPDVHGWVEV